MLIDVLFLTQVESGCVQSSQYDDSSAGSDDESEVARPLNILACTSQGNSNDAISTSGEVFRYSAIVDKVLYLQNLLLVSYTLYSIAQQACYIFKI